MKKMWMWFLLLTKRLYKKITFLTILLLIPVLVLGYHAAAKGDSGMISVAFAQKDDDPLAKVFIREFDADSQLIRYIPCDTPEEAEDLVRGGKVDMAWIFEEDLQARMEEFVKQPRDKNALATVLLREDNVTLRLAREKLSGSIYRELSRRLYLKYIRDNFPALEGYSDEKLLEYYQGQSFTDDLFTYDESDSVSRSIQTSHYLTAPVRGLLAVIVVLCGMATAMYYIQDSRRGTFGWVSVRRLPLVELGCQLVSIVNVTAVVMLALFLSGQAAGVVHELAAAVLYCFCCAGFCMLLRQLCRSVRVMGTMLPLLLVLMLVVCPVFIDLGALRKFQFLFPPTYFINAAYNPKFLLYMPLYTLACFGIYALIDGVRTKK